jgi:hypothetical protein
MGFGEAHRTVQKINLRIALACALPRRSFTRLEATSTPSPPNPPLEGEAFIAYRSRPKLAADIL